MESKPPARIAIDDMVGFLNKLVEFAFKSGMQLEIPTLLITGAQSKGKSSLVEGLLGFPFNHTAHNIATKCPLYIHQEKAAEYPSPMWWIEDRLSPMTTSQVTEYISSHNSQLASVSATPLRLRVKYANCVNLSFIDLPGVRTFGATAEEEAMVVQTKAILTSILTEMGSRAIVLVVQKAEDQIANFATLAKVRDIVPKENIIVVLNMLDLMLNGHTPRQGIIEGLEEADGMLKDYPTFFTSFPNSEMKDKITREHHTEGDRIAEFRRAVAEKAENDREAIELLCRPIDRVGSDLLEKYILERMRREFKKALPTLLTQLRRAVEEINCELQDLKQLPSTEEYESQRPALNTLCASFAYQLRKVLEGEVLDVALKQCTFTLEHEYEAYQQDTGDPTRYPFVTYFNSSPSIYSELQKMLGAHISMCGGASLSRALDEFKMAIWTLQMTPEILEEDVMNTRLGRTAGSMEPRTWDHVIRLLLKKRSKEDFGTCVTFFCKRISWLLRKMYNSALQLARNDAKDGDLVLQRYPALMLFIQKVYVQSIEEWTSTAAEYMQNVVEACVVSPMRRSRDSDFLTDLRDSYSKKDLLERVKRAMGPQQFQELDETESVLRDQLRFTEKDHPLDPLTIQKVRRVCNLKFDHVRVNFVEQIPMLYCSHIELQVFDKLQVRLVAWASKEQLGDVQPRVKELEERKKETERWIQSLATV